MRNDVMGYLRCAGLRQTQQMVPGLKITGYPTAVAMTIRAQQLVLARPHLPTVGEGREW